VPSESGVAVADHEPSPAAAAFSVCTGDPVRSVLLKMRTLTLGESPGAVPALPLRVGVVSFVYDPSGGLVKKMAGSAVLIVQVAV
jgi:hypothetical protein